MKLVIGVFIFIVTMVVCATFVLAQTVVDPSGHWEGTITAPFGEVAVELDLKRDSGGRVSGTFSQPAQNVSGMPLSAAELDGLFLNVKIPGGQFNGTLMADGKAYTGDFSIPQGSAPFSLTRTGDARVTPPLTSPAVAHEIEGRWRGALEVNGKSLRLELTLANQPDGTSINKVVSLDEGGMELPVTVAQQARTVVVTVKMNGAVYEGTLNADNTEMTGTYRLKETALPLTLRVGK